MYQAVMVDNLAISRKAINVTPTQGRTGRIDRLRDLMVSTLTNRLHQPPPPRLWRVRRLCASWASVWQAKGLRGASASWRRFAVTVDSREFLSIGFQYGCEVSLWGLNGFQPLLNLFITQFDV